MTRVRDAKGRSIKKIDLGRFDEEVYEEVCSMVPPSYKLAWIDGHIFFYGDPQGLHEAPCAAVSKAVRAYLSPLARMLYEYRSSDFQLTQERRKQPDESWASGP